MSTQNQGWQLPPGKFLVQFFFGRQLTLEEERELEQAVARVVMETLQDANNGEVYAYAIPRASPPEKK